MILFISLEVSLSLRPAGTLGVVVTAVEVSGWCEVSLYS